MRLEVGDIVLTHRKGFISGCIRFGQRLRFKGANRWFAKWSHAALVISPEGDIVEALTRGITHSHLSKYDGVEYIVIHTGTNPLDQREILKFAGAELGAAYGWLTILCLALGLVTGTKFTFGYGRSQICSGFVACAMERAGEVFPRAPEDVMPADLAHHYLARGLYTPWEHVAHA